MPSIQGHGLRQAAAVDLNGAVTRLDYHVVDMGRLGIRPTQQSLAPDGGSLGSSNAFMSVSADVAPVSTARALGTVASSFTPAEPVDYYLNGVLAATFTADVNGRLGVFINSGSAEGFITVDARGQVSGKRAGGVAQLLVAAPTAPGLSVAPHAINPTGTSTINMMGTRYPASTVVSSRSERRRARHCHYQRHGELLRERPRPGGHRRLGGLQL